MGRSASRPAENIPVRQECMAKKNENRCRAAGPGQSTEIDKYRKQCSLDALEERRPQGLRSRAVAGIIGVLDLLRDLIDKKLATRELTAASEGSRRRRSRGRRLQTDPFQDVDRTVGVRSD